MEKPDLIDYDLKKSDLERYETQKEILKKNEEIAQIKCDEYNKKLKIWVTTSIALYSFCVFMYSVLSNENINVFALIFVWILFPFIISLLCGYIESKKLKEVEWLEQVMYGMFFSIIGMGIFIYSALEKVVEINKYEYVDKRLEDKINLYNKDLSQYNEYLFTTQKAFWENLSGYEFEHEVAKLYQKIGYNTYVTKATGDGGVDIILTKNGEKIAVQCKHHLGPVGPHDFRALIGTIVNGGYKRGIFVSLNGFTAGVINEKRISQIDIELVDIVSLVAYSRNLAEEKFPSKAKEDPIRVKPKQNVFYNKYLGAIVKYDKPGYGIGYVKSIEDDKVYIRFSNNGKQPFDKCFLLNALNNSIEIIKLENLDE